MSTASKNTATSRAATRPMQCMLAFIAAIVALAMTLSPAAADVTLPAIISSNMVLQREMPVPIWGWAKADEKVTVTLGEQSVSGVADKDGKWSVKLAAMKAGGPFDLVVTGANTIKLAGVIVGEVWLCSGQSNMELPTGSALNPKVEIATVKEMTGVRFFRVGGATSPVPVKDIKSKWEQCDDRTAGGFSAVAFFFARHLWNEQKVPVGMIQASYNGSQIQGWMPSEAWQGDARLESDYDKFVKQNAGDVADYKKRLADWESAGGSGKAPAMPRGASGMNSPSALHNAMIAPIIPYGIRGLLWYQGESNAGGDKLYKIRFDNMITSWRKMWGQGDFWCLWVQLPNFKSENMFWMEFQELQEMSLSLKNSGMCVTNDIGEFTNIHPANKQEVSRRLWQIAAAKIYGQKDLEYSGPMFEAMKIDGAKALLTFTHTGGGLVAKGAADGKMLTGFVIAGEDGKFAPATAVLDGDKVIVTGEGIAKPTAVRYAWELNPKGNLWNKAGLPAGPFRTDRNGESAMPLVRPKVVPVAVPYSKDPIKVDGDASEWKNIPAMPLPFMKKDTSSVKMCWREDGLYVLATVKDEAIKVLDKTPWYGDALELFIEKDAAGRGERTDAAAQYAFAPAADGSTEGEGVKVIAYGKDKAADLPCQWKKTADGYIMEILIPAANLKPAAMADGTQIGCNFSLDNAGKPVELFYADKNANDSYQVPTTWGLIRLVK